MRPATNVADEVRALERLDLEGLRSAWRQHVGTPPALRSPDLLRHILAWKIQAAALGGLDAETRRLLRQSGGARGPGLNPGTVICREWKGARHEVRVTEAGFVYDGACFDSLSKIATQITGVKWNGPRFFGLRAEAGK